MKLLPDAIVRPMIDVLVGFALKVEPRDLRRPHAVKREAAIVIAVYELVRRRRSFGQNAEPPKRILPIVNLNCILRN